MHSLNCIRLGKKCVKWGVFAPSEGKATALMLRIQANPCITHLENHVGKKLITVLFTIGADIFQRARGLKSLKRYCNSVGHIANTQILGTVIHPKQWKVPVDDSSDSISKVSFSNKKTCEFIDNTEALVNHIFWQWNMWSRSKYGSVYFKTTEMRWKSEAATRLY
jgi:hypothetical protein